MTYFEPVTVTNVSNSSRCSSYDIPSITEYLNATNEYGIAVLCVGGLALIVVIFMFIDTLRYVIIHSSSSVKGYTAFVIAVYPVSCLVSYCVILVPRAHLLSEALTQGMVMCGVYQLFCLFVAYSGGDAGLVKIVKPNNLSLQVGPLCCFPCCSRLPTLEVNKKSIRFLKVLVLQLPIVQGLAYFVFLVMWAEAERLYQINYMYMQPVIIISILFGVWGILMAINLLKDTLNSQFLLLHKFLVLQLVLLLSKLQGLITRALVWFHVLPCNPPITPQVYATLIHNMLMIMEMVILGFLARKLYKRNIPDIENRKSKTTGIISTLGSSNIRNGSITSSISSTVNNNVETNNCYTNNSVYVVSA